MPASSATEQTSLLRDPPSRSPQIGGAHAHAPERGRRAGSVSASASASSASPPTRLITLEDHRPGRPTTFSLLSSAASRDNSLERPIAPTKSYDSLAEAKAAISIPSAIVTIADQPAGSNTNGNGLDTPYRYGDGRQGYQVLFPRSSSELSLQAASDEAARIAWHVSCAIWLSLSVNIVLFVSKTYSAFASRSLAVAASAVDSLLDLASQGIVYLAERGSKNVDTSLYPAGRSRLEPVGIIVCAALMGCAALQLIMESAEQLYEGYSGNMQEHAIVTFNAFSLSLLLLTIVGKLALWLYCAAFAKHSPTLFTLAVDHRNDVLSNTVALVAALIAWKWSEAWSADPIGAIVMSLYIVLNWTGIALEQIEHVVGRAADPDFLMEIQDLSSTFHSQLTPDVIRAYHFGAKYLVELEVILPEDMTVREAHDIALALQQSIEQMEAVERAFVHVDWRGRDGEDEHNYEAIATKIKSAAQHNNQQ